MLFPQFGGPGTLRLFGFRLAFEAALRISLETMAATSVFETGKMTSTASRLLEHSEQRLGLRFYFSYRTIYHCNHFISRV